MKSKTIIISLVIITVIVISYLSVTTNNREGYNSSCISERESKDSWFRTSTDSPFFDAPESFEGLKYFDPDPNYIIIGELEPTKNKKAVLLATNSGKEIPYLEYATINFSVDGENHNLKIFEVLEKGDNNGMLFLAFTDETSGRETYGSGRYLDVRKVRGTNTIELDFNKSYNPYCAYSDEFSCPFPPKENNLTIPIFAGEKIYKPSSSPEIIN